MPIEYLETRTGTRRVQPAWRMPDEYLKEELPWAGADPLSDCECYRCQEAREEQGNGEKLSSELAKARELAVRILPPVLLRELFSEKRIVVDAGDWEWRLSLNGNLESIDDERGYWTERGGWPEDEMMVPLERLVVTYMHLLADAENVDEVACS